MKIEKLSVKIETFQVNLLAVAGLLLTVIPFVWMIMTSVKPPEEVFIYPPKLFPEKITFEYYRRLFKDIAFLLHFKNSAILALAILIVSLFTNSLAGFAFAKYRFPGKEKIFTLLLATMMIPSQMTMIPNFLLLKKLGLLNTYLGLIVTAATSVFGIFLIRQFMLSIPDEIIEAARIEGCSEFQIYYKIVLPLSKPILATLSIFTFMGAWNDFLWPLIVMIKEDMYTLPVALAKLNSQYGTEYGLLMAGATIVIIPILLIFLFGQKYIIRGIATTGLKE